MTDEQRVRVRKSEVRSRLAELGAIEQMSEEQEAEVGTLTTEYRSLETRERALVIAGDAPDEPDGVDANDMDAEGRELRSLQGSVSLATYLGASVAEREVDGAELELRQHYGLGGNQVPWAAIAPAEQPEAAVDREMRAVSAAPDTVGIEQDPILARVFRRSDAMFLRVGMPSVGVGQRNYPVLTSVSAEPANYAKDAEAAQPNVTFTPYVLSPTRLSAQYLWRREDAAVFAGMEEALREDLSMAMSQALDRTLMNGDGSGANVPGFLGGHANGLARPAAASPDQAFTFPDYIAQQAGEVDGLYANSLMDVRALIGADTYEHAASLFAQGTEISPAAYLERQSGGFRVSGHIAAAATSSGKTTQFGVLCKGMARAAVAPIWEGVTLIRDEITQARQGQIAVTAVMLYNFRIIRKAQYSAKRYRTA